MKAIRVPPPMTTGVRRPSDNVMTALGRLTAGVFPVDFGVQVAPGRNDCNLSDGHATMIDALELSVKSRIR